MIFITPAGIIGGRVSSFEKEAMESLLPNRVQAYEQNADSNGSQ
jgi:uncharacterized membrane protein YagU involved in acid resistance